MVSAVMNGVCRHPSRLREMVVFRFLSLHLARVRASTLYSPHQATCALRLRFRRPIFFYRATHYGLSSLPMFLWCATLFCMPPLPLSTLQTRELRLEVLIREYISSFPYSVRVWVWGMGVE